jgi:FlaA1/EpsC-like NDP-sugar epimerase
MLASDVLTGRTVSVTFVNFEGRLVLVTGAGGGLGRALSKELAAAALARS